VSWFQKRNWKGAKKYHRKFSHEVQHAGKADSVSESGGVYGSLLPEKVPHHSITREEYSGCKISPSGRVILIVVGNLKEAGME
jgi:hypothetical protein